MSCSQVPTKFYVTCKCARRECGRVTCLFLSVSLVFSHPVSFYCRSGTYETSFGVEPAALGLSFGDTADEIFSSTSESDPPPSISSPSLPKFRNIITLSPKRFPLSLPRASEIPREYTPRGDGGYRLRERAPLRISSRATKGRAAGLTLHLYSLRKVRSRPRSLNSIICGISSATSNSFLLSSLPSLACRIKPPRRDRRVLHRRVLCSSRKRLASRTRPRRGETAAVDLPQKSRLVPPRGV